MQKLSSLIEKILKNIFKKHGPIFSEIMLNWGKIVGGNHSQISKPIKINQLKERNKTLNILHVEVNHAGASVELSFQHDIILERIAIYFGYKAIDKIKFYIRPKVIDI